MGDFFTFVNNGGKEAWLIFCMGIFGAVIIVERMKCLFFDFSMKADEFSAKIQSYIMSDKIEDAIKYCDAHPKSPLSYVVKGVLERSDRDDSSIHQALDIKYAEVLPKLSKRFGYLQMLSNVAMLMGLLGTIHGLMISFEAVSFADPSQKQTLLTQGIAMYMSATAMGLGVAIPIMFFYAILHAQSNKIVNQIIENAGKIVDLLTNRNYEVFDKTKIYSSNTVPEKASEKKGVPPPPRKAS